MKPAPDGLSGADERAVRGRIRSLTGLAFPESLRTRLVEGVAHGMGCAGLKEPMEYLARLEGEPELLDDLVTRITVGETYFFRDPAQCELVRKRILPDLLRRRAGRPLRIWSAGCATGEEAYTLAILHGEVAGVTAPAHILGTDLSRQALARARSGRYPRRSLRSLPPEALGRYFKESDGAFLVARDRLGTVDFRYLNLAEDTYPTLASGAWAMDLILCRNVLIYFDREMAADVTRRMMASLAPGGWLLLGASDPLPPDPEPCDTVVTDAGIAYRRPDVESGPPPDAMVGMAPEIPWRSLGTLPRAVPPPRPPVAEPIEASRQEGAEGLDVWVTRVRHLANRGALEDASAECSRALTRHPMSAELTYLLGILSGEAGHPEAALSALRGALYLDSSLAVAHLGLAGVLLRMGNAQGARRSMMNAHGLLASQPPEAEVPASDGERAGRLLAACEAGLAILAGTGEQWTA